MSSLDDKPKPKIYKDMESMARDHGYMTGEEFYDRFLKELPEGKFYQWNDDIGVYKELKEAAKRAAGLTE